MFEKIYQKIDDVFNQVTYGLAKHDSCYTKICNGIESIQGSIHHAPKIESMQKTIDSQQRTIEQLTNALKDKYEHGLFIFSEDCKIPMVIRNGKALTNELTSYFGIEWNIGEIPVLNIEQRAGTYHDMEV